MIHFEAYKKGNEIAIHKLVKMVYDRFVAPDYSDAGNEFFYNYIVPEKIAERQLMQNNIWLAKNGDEIVGMIEIRDNSYISLLFVKNEFQGKGIAKELFRMALNATIERVSPDKFYVHASPFSILVYEDWAL